MGPSRDTPLNHRLRLAVPLFVTLLFAGAPLVWATPYEISPAPVWIDAIPLDPSTAVPKEQVSSGVYDLVVDSQTRVVKESQTNYRRMARKVLSATGVDTASELRIPFDPSFQKLRFHHIRITRDGSPRDVLSREHIRIIQQETELDQKIYDGSLTALVFLPDVRPGDVIDYAYSVDGANPTLRGRYVGTVTLAYGVPVKHLRWRLLWENGRTLHVTKRGTDVEPQAVRTGDGTVYTWEKRDVAPIDVDTDLPAWFDPLPSVTLSEFPSWGEVAQWGVAMFSTATRGGRTLDELVAGWKRDSADPETRLLAAIRFVQDDIRYLGIEIGPYSHQPHPPEDVLRQRFGDCKDKSLLLVAALRELGIEAHPALVNSWAREAIDGWQPSPYAFDHVIVTFRFAGRTYWVDATASQQGGTLATMAIPEFRRALIVDGSTAGLTAIPPPASDTPTTVIEERYIVPAYDQPARLEVETVYNGSEADAMRQLLSSTAPADLAKDYLNHYANDDPGIEALEPPQVADDRLRNRLVVTEAYKLPSFWKEKQRDFYAWGIDERIYLPPTPRRRMPMAIAYPVHVRHTLTVQLPDAFDVKPETTTIATNAFRFKTSSRLTGKTIRLEYDFQTLSDAVAASAAPKHIEELKKVRDNLGYGIWYDRAAAALTPQRSGTDASWAWKVPATVGGGALLAAIIGAIAGWMAFGRGASAFTRPGATPLTAIRVSDGESLDRRLMLLRCACGSGYRHPLPQRAAVFNERRLLIVDATCDRCGVVRTVHFDAGTANAFAASTN
ncbi:MAG: DUF3857 domain-containing transglutaminase family protein [Thermoanaerobaculia bacterium]